MSHRETVTAGFRWPPLRRPGGLKISPVRMAPLRPPMTASATSRSSDVQSGVRVTQPPDDRHRQEQHDGGERELVGGTRQAQPT